MEEKYLRKIEELENELNNLKQSVTDDMSKDQKALIATDINRVNSKIRYYKNRDKCIEQVRENKSKKSEYYRKYNTDYNRKKRELADKDALREYNRIKKRESRARQKANKENNNG